MMLTTLDVITWTFPHPGLDRDPEVPRCPLCRSQLALDRGLEGWYRSRILATCTSEDCGCLLALVFEPGRLSMFLMPSADDLIEGLDRRTTTHDYIASLEAAAN